jgi:putative membrane protein
VDEPGVEDATRRTRLANERTYLAWWRTGLTAFAVCVGVGRLVPELTGSTLWPYEVVGALYGVLGIGFVLAAYLRVRRVEAALRRGGYAPLTDALAAGLAAAGVVLGVLTVVLVLVVD